MPCNRSAHDRELYAFYALCIIHKVCGIVYYCVYLLFRDFVFVSCSSKVGNYRCCCTGDCKNRF